MRMRKKSGRILAALAALMLAATGVLLAPASAPDAAYAASSGWSKEGVAWMAPASGGRPVYRLFYQPRGWHHYTMDEHERDVLAASGWKVEKIAFNADLSGRPVYRVFNPASGEHHYTMDGNERNVLVGQGWHDEGVAWYVGSSADVPVYRVHNPVSGEHLWTTDYNEYETLGRTPVAGGPNALGVLARLAVNDSQAPGYRRDAFGEAWADVDGNGCRTRDDILARDLMNVTKLDSCRVRSGILHDPYTGTVISFVRGADADNDGGIQIDHVVSLSNAWKSGANTWTDRKRLKYANDPYVLLAVDDQANEDKRDYAADKWLPADAGYRCQYVARQIGIKAKYSLSVTNAELGAMSRVLASCPAQPIPDGSGLPADPAPQPAPSPSPSPAPSPAPQVQHGITPGAFCSPEGATGIGKRNGVTYTCKRDNGGRLRWRR